MLDADFCDFVGFNEILAETRYKMQQLAQLYEIRVENQNLLKIELKMKRDELEKL